MSIATLMQSLPAQTTSNQALTNLTKFNDVVQSIRILKVASCPTSSYKATLTYHINCTNDKDIQFRVTLNSEGGLFSPEWVYLSDIQPAFERLAWCRTVAYSN
jgi:hypothetical protein